MKKLICLCLSLCLCLAALPVLGEAGEAPALEAVIKADSPAADDIKVIDPASLTAPTRAAEGSEADFSKLEAPAADDAADRSVTADVVTISGSSTTCILPTGTTFKYSAPNGVLVFTQDLAQQAAQFAKYYKQPQEVVDKFIERSMHFNIYDTVSGVDVYLYVYQTDLATLYPSSNNLTSQEAEALIRYMFTDKYYFENCPEASYGWAGGNVWLIGDGRSTGKGVVLCSFVGGLEIFSIVKASTDAEYNKIIELLQNLTIQ